MTISQKQLAGLSRRQHDFVSTIEANTEGLAAVSVGVCPGCAVCKAEYVPDATMKEFEELWSSGVICAEPFFSWDGCDLCGSPLGGNFENWHATDENNEIVHGDRACEDCVQYLANGDLPEDSER